VTGSDRAVHVYYADRRMLSDATISALVTVEDRQRLAAAMHARRRAEYLAGRALLRHALAHCTGKNAASFRIEVAVDGKPECIGGPAISLSHSGDFLVCALAAAGPIGIDVEIDGPRRSLAAIAERFFTPAEAQWLAADPVPRFRMLWVLKEAYLKALGSGLAGGLDSLECAIEPPVVVARAAGAATPQLLLLAGQGCHVGVAALGAPRVALEVRRLADDATVDALGPLSVVARTG
jgi:phosphopantetheinyl transferase